jgi:uncharacterized integral membrane protein
MESALVVLLAIMLGAIAGIIVGLRRMFQMEKTILAIDRKLAGLTKQKKKRK